MPPHQHVLPVPKWLTRLAGAVFEESVPKLSLFGENISTIRSVLATYSHFHTFGYGSIYATALYIAKQLRSSGLWAQGIKYLDEVTASKDQLLFVVSSSGSHPKMQELISNYPGDVIVICLQRPPNTEEFDSRRVRLIFPEHSLMTDEYVSTANSLTFLYLFEHCLNEETALRESYKFNLSRTIGDSVYLVHDRSGRELAQDLAIRFRESTQIHLSVINDNDFVHGGAFSSSELDTILIGLHSSFAEWTNRFEELIFLPSHESTPDYSAVAEQLHGLRAFKALTLEHPESHSYPIKTNEVSLE